MLGVLILTVFLPALVNSAGEGNIRLLEEDVAAALKTCAESDTSVSATPARQRRFADNAQIEQETNIYSHERRNVSDMKDQISVVNATEEYSGYGNNDEKLVNSVPKTAGGSYQGEGYGTNRTRRSEPLFNRPDNDQCLSQCVFANLQVVDSRGIPREAELWNKVQSSVTSQQSRAALKDQISACFQELQSEAEDNGCSYSNKLERCLMLRFSDREPGQQSNDQQQNKS